MSPAHSRQPFPTEDRPMPLLYARIVVDDRPGSLAAVTRGLAAAGADIVTVDVLGSEGGLAVDDFVLRVADGPLGAQVVRELAGLPGVAVESVRIARDTPERRPDLDALARMLRDPGRSLQTYVERLPDVLRADWALGLMPVGDGEIVVVARSRHAPREAEATLPGGGPRPRLRCGVHGPRPGSVEHGHGVLRGPPRWTGGGRRPRRRPVLPDPGAVPPPAALRGRRAAQRSPPSRLNRPRSAPRPPT